MSSRGAAPASSSGAVSVSSDPAGMGPNSRTLGYDLAHGNDSGRSGGSSDEVAPVWWTP